MAGKPAAQIVTLEKLLAGRSAEVRKWTRALRKIVRGAVPQSYERCYKGWNVVAFARAPGMKMNDMFCGLSPLKDSVGLYFHAGAKLPDPEGLLRGSGKSMRHVKVRSDRDIRRAAIRRLVRAAYRGRR